MSAEERSLYKTAGIALGVILLPMVILSFFNVPSVDDYYFGTLVQNYVRENGYHILGILKCGFQNMAHYYMTWQGRYSESFLASFMPDIFHAYWLSAFLMLGGLASGIWYLFRSIVKGLVGKEYLWISNLLAIFALLAITQNLPSAAEGFYWFDGSMAYMLHHSFYLVMCAFAVQYLCADTGAFSIGRMGAWLFLTVLVAGGNNVTAFVSILTYCVFLGIAFLRKKKGWILLPFFVSIVGFLVSYLSPGTVIRGGERDSYNSILATVLKCFRWTLRQYLLDWTTAAIVIMVIVSLPFMAKLVDAILQKYHFRFPVPGLLLAGSICFLSAMSSPPFYILRESGPLRLHNVIYVNYILLIYINVIYFLGWLSVKLIGESGIKSIASVYSKWPVKFSTGLLAVMILFLCAGNGTKYGTSIEAVKELATGQVAQYHREAMVRKALYTDETVKNVVVEPYSVRPELLFIDDITDNEIQWKNEGLSLFYGKESIVLSEYADYIEYD